jgi:hypothetical protein
MALGDAIGSRPDTDRDPTLENRTDESPVTIYYYDPATPSITLKYTFTPDPRVKKDGVPPWVTQYHTFPRPVREALEDLYAMWIRSERYSIRN